MKQLQTLVHFMEENSELARGAPVFGANKLTSEEKWGTICRKLNSMGPPSRTIAEWKKTWADLKSRTKKKIANNQKSLKQTGGGLYSHSNLTGLELVIDRILSLSSAAAPSGAVFGFKEQSLDDCFHTLNETSMERENPVDMDQIAHEQKPQQQEQLPTQQQSQLIQLHPPQQEQLMLQEGYHQPQNKEGIKQQQQQLPQKKQQLLQRKKLAKCSQQQGKGIELSESCLDSDTEQPSSTSAKKRKTVVDQQLGLIRRQLRVSERSSATLLEQAQSMKRLADAAERSAAAAEATASSLKEMSKMLETFLENLKK